MKQILFFIYVFFTALFAGGQTIPQSGDSALSSSENLLLVKYLFPGETNYELWKNNLYAVDSSLRYFDIFNPVYSPPFSFDSHLGSLGSAARNQELILMKRPGNFIRNSPFSKYEYQPSGTKYYQAQKRYTDIFFMMGSKKEQLFTITHTQNITPRWNAGLDFRKIVSDGFFVRQETDISNLNVFTWYRTKNERYNLFANAYFNKLILQENGGVQSDSIFENSGDTDLKLIPVNLALAESRLRSKGATIQQSWDMGYKNVMIVNDSMTRYKFVSAHRLVHTFSFENRSSVFDDQAPSSSNYSKFYYDTARTLDSLWCRQFVNALQWTHLPFRRSADSLRKIFLSVEVSQRYAEYTQRETDTTNLNYFVKWGAGNRNKSLSVEGEYAIAGDNQGDYFATGTIGRQFGYHRIFIRFKSSALSPGIQYTRWTGNNFKWENNFDQEKINTASLQSSFWNNKLILGTAFSGVNNFLYFDSTGIAQQYRDNISLVKGWIYTELKAGGFGFTSNILLQSASSSLMPVPLIATFHSLWIEHRVFKNALLVRTGTDIRYSSAYHAPLYFPSTGQFGVQEKINTGNFPIADIFISAKIRRARMFVKLENLLGGLLPSPYYEIPHYPLANRVFRFGISWRFLD